MSTDVTSRPVGPLGVRQEPVVILCGGQGTRMREETEFRPKALVEIGGKPVLWHLMQHYVHYGYRKFILCLGYRGNMIKEYFINYHWMANDFTLRMSGTTPTIVPHGASREEWQITFVDTGVSAQTGARLFRIRELIDEDYFLANYCDGLSTVDLTALVEFHRLHGKTATLTGFHPHSKFGVIRTDDHGVVYHFQEKPLMNELTSGGYFVFDRRIFNYLSDDDHCILETTPFQRLAAERQMALFTHNGFWQCMDTFKEAQALNALWDKGNAPWKVWA